jgi:hypothetical protein
MGPLSEIYRHPWMQEEYHTWDFEEGSSVFRIFYRYPESPSYGFFVKCYGPSMFDVGPVKFTDGTAKRSGTCYHHSTAEAVTEHIEKLYLKDQAMDKVYELEEFIVAPF